VAGAVTLLAVATGCGAVRLDPSSVSASGRRACLSLVEDLPHRVSERPRRETKGSPLGAAWGDPAIVLRCGVGTPDGYKPFSPCQRVDGVDWFVPEKEIADQGSDVLLTTIGRDPNVELAVPSEYRPPDAAMVDLAEAIKSDTKVVTPCS
jgi:hypothetical protein